MEGSLSYLAQHRTMLPDSHTATEAWLLVRQTTFLRVDKPSALFFLAFGPSLCFGSWRLPIFSYKISYAFKNQDTWYLLASLCFVQPLVRINQEPLAIFLQVFFFFFLSFKWTHSHKNCSLIQLKPKPSVRQKSYCSSWKNYLPAHSPHYLDPKQLSVGQARN